MTNKRNSKALIAGTQKDGTVPVIRTIPPNLKLISLSPRTLMLTGLQPPRVGLEPTTPRLTAVCSTIELSRKTVLLRKTVKEPSVLPAAVLLSLEVHALKTKYQKSVSVKILFPLVKPSTD